MLLQTGTTYTPAQQAARDAYTRAAIRHHETDAAWSAVLQATYGKRAGDARYDDRGTATAELATLRAAAHAAGEARSLAFEAVSQARAF